MSSLKQVERCPGGDSGESCGPAEIPLAIARAVGFLLERQSSDGAWRDFLLYPGRSDSWVTAYAGSRLLRVLHHWTLAGLRPALEAALRFLDDARGARGGWGYNTRCPSDADSTAQAILFLRQARGQAELRDYAILARFQLPQGGFATYNVSDPNHGWGREHTDVTVVALQALAGILAPDHTILRRGYARLAAHLQERDPTASYWWPSRFYMPRELLALWHACPEAPRCSLPELPLPSNANCFDQALALEVALLRGLPPAQVSDVVRRLRSLQASDGGWPTAPILRVTDPRAQTVDDRYCRESQVTCDDRRLFTTATVMSSLHLFERLSYGAKRLEMSRIACVSPST